MYTVKKVAEIMNISVHTLRFYDNEGLFPYVSRNKNNIRLFSEHDLEWVTLVQCLRDTDMPLADIKRYVELCMQGDTLEERYHIILKQKEKAEQEVSNMQKRVEILNTKSELYKGLLLEQKTDKCNPQNSKLQ